MKISTCGHGAFPDLKSLAHAGPRIAFVNGDSRQFAARGTHEVGDLLIVVADDINRSQISYFARIMLALPATISSRYKRYLLRGSAVSGYPSVPMAIDDAVTILEYFERARANRATELVISCEYGKSRSVTVARMIEAYMMGFDITKDGVPNAWVGWLLHVAMTKRNCQLSMFRYILKISTMAM